MIINTKEEISNFEKVSINVSEQYVPIKTSEFIKEFEPTFVFKKARQYRQGSNAHYVELTQENQDVSVYIENSFDRSLSLRISFRYKDFIFGKIRQVHKGISAVNINSNKQDIMKLYTQACMTVDSLRDTVFTQREKDLILYVAFKEKGKNYKYIKGISDSNGLDFITTLISDIKHGNLEYKSSSGWKQLKETKSEFMMVNISNAIWTVIYKKFPEYYI